MTRPHPPHSRGCPGLPRYTSTAQEETRDIRQLLWLACKEYSPGASQGRGGPQYHLHPKTTGLQENIFAFNALREVKGLGSASQASILPRTTIEAVVFQELPSRLLSIKNIKNLDWQQYTTLRQWLATIGQRSISLSAAGLQETHHMPNLGTMVLSGIGSGTGVTGLALQTPISDHMKTQPVDCCTEMRHTRKWVQLRERDRHTASWSGLQPVKVQSAILHAGKQKSARDRHARRGTTCAQRYPHTPRVVIACNSLEESCCHPDTCLRACSHGPCSIPPV